MSRYSSYSSFDISIFLHHGKTFCFTKFRPYVNKLLSYVNTWTELLHVKQRLLCSTPDYNRISREMLDLHLCPE